MLRTIGSWDPHNVTQDADLGIRFARFGYRSAVIASTTYEEAPARFRPWLRQRTRWYKGWVQTWLVHMRRPVALLRELGGGGFLTFQLVVAGNVFSALIFPLFAGLVAARFAGGAPIDPNLAGLHLAVLCSGVFATVFTGLVGLNRRRILTSAWVLIGTPVHWLLLSLAAWRGLLQLIRKPYYWEKTEHGLACSSRRRRQRAPLSEAREQRLPFIPAQAGLQAPNGRAL